MRVFIPGVGGFVGCHLAKRILEETEWEIAGIDKNAGKIAGLLSSSRFQFAEADVAACPELVRECVEDSDVVVPLVAIPTPGLYTREPLQVFETTFLENYKIITCCADADKRLVFPSSSEVYGLCNDSRFTEESSNLVFGSTSALRWIYACSKQMLERVIWAYGSQRQLRFTIFRPFNWIGPRLDSLDPEIVQYPRVVVQFIRDMVLNKPIHIADGGAQKRCFTFVTDGIDCLMKILKAPDDIVNRQVFNIGNPNNEITVSELADRLLRLFRTRRATASEPVVVRGEDLHGPGYQDMAHRTPCIDKTARLLGWQPTTDLALQRRFIGRTATL